MRAVDPTRESTASEESERLGVQWRTIGAGLAIFLASCLLTYAVGDSALSWQDRASAALTSAGYIFFGTIVGLGFLSRFVRARRISSNTVFVVAWILAFVVWWVVAYHRGVTAR